MNNEIIIYNIISLINNLINFWEKSIEHKTIQNEIWIFKKFTQAIKGP